MFFCNQLSYAYRTLGSIIEYLLNVYSPIETIEVRFCVLPVPYILIMAVWSLMTDSCPVPMSLMSSRMLRKTSLNTL